MNQDEEVKNLKKEIDHLLSKLIRYDEQLLKKNNDIIEHNNVVLEKMASNFEEQLKISHHTHTEHVKLNKFTRRLVYATYILAICTFIIGWLTYIDNRKLKEVDWDKQQADWVYKEYQNMEKISSQDSVINFIFYQKHPDSFHIDFTRRNIASINTFLNFFQELNVLYTNDIIDSKRTGIFLKDYLDEIYSKKYVHEYVSNYRISILKSDVNKDSSSVAGIFDAIYIWAKRWGIKNPVDTVNRKWEKWYSLDEKYEDGKSIEHLFQ